MEFDLKKSDIALIISALDTEADSIGSAIRLLLKNGIADTDQAVTTLRKRGQKVSELLIAFQLAKNAKLTGVALWGEAT